METTRMPYPQRSSAWPIALTLAVGLTLGFLMGTSQPRPLLATGPDRPFDSIMVSAPIRTEQNQTSKMQFTLDAVYYLNYSTAQLCAALPVDKRTVGARQ